LIVLLISFAQAGRLETQTAHARNRCTLRVAPPPVYIVGQGGQPPHFAARYAPPPRSGQFLPIQPPSALSRANKHAELLSAATVQVTFCSQYCPHQITTVFGSRIAAKWDSEYGKCQRRSAVTSARSAQRLRHIESDRTTALLGARVDRTARA
jgi:hypothetical protein